MSSALFRNVKSYYSVSTAPTFEPVSLAEVRQRLRYDSDDKNEELTRLIAAARTIFERDCSVSCCTQSITLKMDCFPSDVIELRRPPAASVTSVSYLDADGATQTYSSANYVLDSTSYPARIYPAFGTTWPSTRAIQNAVTVIYVAGFTSQANVPANWKEAIKTYIEYIWHGRPDEILEAYKMELMACRWGNVL